MSTPPRERRPIFSFSVSNSATISNPSSRKPGVVGEREAEVAGAHDGDADAAVQPEDLPQVPPQLLDVVADAADAELAEIRQVLPDLRGIQVELLGQRLRRDRAHAHASSALRQRRYTDRRLVVSSDTGSACARDAARRQLVLLCHKRNRL